MRLGSVLGGILLTCLAASVSAAGDFPYKAYVVADDVHVRSGPGDNYYPTARLRRGDMVEVYRHDPGGWYAVRPPEGSFSWVSSRHLQPRDDGIAVVAGDRVVARVGSTLGNQRDVIQVRLDRGEEVELLESKRLAADGQTERWYKIAPPAGEFRWIFGKYVQRPGQEAKPPEAEEFAPIDASSGLSRSFDRTGGRQGAVARGGSSARRAPTGRGGVDAEIDRIDLLLGALVAKEARLWNFEELGVRARAARDRATTTAQRQRAESILDRIARFEDIQRRQEAIAAVGGGGNPSARQVAAGASAPETTRYATLDPRFDGSGRLAVVAQNNLGAPQYALVDSAGKVRCYVSAAPGVNLRNYVGREVGVYGQRGYLANLNTQHVMAKHVTVTDDRIVR
jgi:hypothetical protein